MSGAYPCMSYLENNCCNCVHQLNHLLSSLLGRQSPGARKYTGPEHNTVKRVLGTRAEGTQGVYRTLTTNNVKGEGRKLTYDDLLYLFILKIRN